MSAYKLLLVFGLSLCFYACGDGQKETSSASNSVQESGAPVANKRQASTIETVRNVDKPVVDKTMLQKKWKVESWDSVDMLDRMGEADYTKYRAARLKDTYELLAEGKNVITKDGKTVDGYWNLGASGNNFKIVIDNKPTYWVVKSIGANVISLESEIKKSKKMDKKQETIILTLKPM